MIDLAAKSDSLVALSLLVRLFIPFINSVDPYNRVGRPTTTRKLQGGNYMCDIITRIGDSSSKIHDISKNISKNIEELNK